MTLRGKIAVLITLSFVTAVGLGFVNQIRASEEILKEERRRICRESLREYLKLLELRGKILVSVSSLIAEDERVVRGLEEGNWLRLYRGLERLYEEMSARGLVGEVVITKGSPPADALRKHPPWSMEVTPERVVLRASSPVVSEEGVIGSVSVGIGVEELLREYVELTGNACGVALREEFVRGILRSAEYERFISERFLVDGYVVEVSDTADPFVLSAVELSPDRREILRNHILLCTVPLRSVSGELMGYFFTYRESSELALISSGLKPVLLLYTPVLSLLFIGWLVAFGKLSARIERILSLINSIRERKFHLLEAYRGREPLDEIDRIESALIELGRELMEYTGVPEEVAELEEKHRDRLTGVYSAEALRDFGTDLVNRHLAVGKPVSALLVDVDDFSRVCKLYGPEICEPLIRSVAHTLSETLRDTDFLFRIGEEDFLVLLPGTPLEGALRVGENLRRRVEMERFSAVNRTVNLTVSVGITEIHRPIRSVDEVLDRVSRALYLAKRTGKNRIAVEE